MVESLKEGVEEQPKSELAQPDTKLSVEAQIIWCTAQIRLGLTNVGITKDQCKKSGPALIFRE
jgi:hypothetical protein